MGRLFAKSGGALAGVITLADPVVTEVPAGVYIGDDGKQLWDWDEAFADNTPDLIPSVVWAGDRYRVVWSQLARRQHQDAVQPGCGRQRRHHPRQRRNDQLLCQPGCHRAEPTAATGLRSRAGQLHGALHQPRRQLERPSVGEGRQQPFWQDAHPARRHPPHPRRCRLLSVHAGLDHHRRRILFRRHQLPCSGRGREHSAG